MNIYINMFLTKASDARHFSSKTSHFTAGVISGIRFCFNAWKSVSQCVGAFDLLVYAKVQKMSHVIVTLNFEWIFPLFIFIFTIFLKQSSNCLTVQIFIYILKILRTAQNTKLMKNISKFEIMSEISLVSTIFGDKVQLIIFGFSVGICLWWRTGLWWLTYHCLSDLFGNERIGLEISKS